MFVTGGARDSEGTPLLRILVRHRRFSAHGKVGIPVKVNIDSGAKVNSSRSEATLTR
jgi:hypothetical protein